MVSKLYYVLISLYGSINFVIGGQIVIYYLINPDVFDAALGDIVIGVTMLVISVLCFAVLLLRKSIRDRLKRLYIGVSLGLSLLAIPALMVLVTADFLTSDDIKPAYCKVKPESSVMQGESRYSCDIRALNLDLLSDPQIPFVTEVFSGRSPTVFVASLASFVIAGALATMITVHSIRRGLALSGKL